MDKQEHNRIDPNKPPFDPMMDTQVLLGMEPAAEGSFNLEDILEEFGNRPPEPTAAEPEAPEPLPQEPEEQPVPEAPPPEESPKPEEVPAPPPEEEPEISAEELLDQVFWEDMLEEPEPAPEEEPARPEAPPEEEPEPPAPPREPPPPPEQPEPLEETTLSEESPVSMEAIVASTVDAVKGEQEQRQEQLRQRLEKIRKKERSARTKEPARSPLPEVENEPLPGEQAVWHKRRFRECRKSLVLAVPVLVLVWLPWVLAQFGTEVPFFSESGDNAALCVLVGQALTSILCWPVYRAALDALMAGTWTVHATALLCTLVTLLDEMTLLLLPERTAAPPLGGVAAVLSVASLWGLTGWHRGMTETFRTAAMGEPSRLTDLCNGALAKGAGGRSGFCTRAVMEDTPAQWQRLLLPVLAAASLVFAVLASVGQERRQDLFWCWSVILCASSSLAFPLAFCVPYGRLAPKLARQGAAMAGHYGAQVLSSTHRLAVTDTDLFPPGSASLNGLKLYGEERNRAISYAATLAVQGGGLLGRLFEDICQRERIGYQGLEHFHIHDDGGLSGIIHGETVLVGPPVFMRRKAVRLPGHLPGKTSLCMAVDGSLTAVFAIKYTAADTVDYALRILRRNGFQLTLATRDGSVTPKLLQELFRSSCGAESPELSERLSLSDPEREAEGPSGLLYREGLLPFASMAAGSRRLCQTAVAGNLLSIAGSIAGVLLGFYLTFTGSYNVLTPLLLLTYLLLWAVPMLPLVWTVDKL